MMINYNSLFISCVVLTFMCQLSGWSNKQERVTEDCVISFLVEKI
jgi:hypothetical protein